jgi:hypothetical protein
MESRLTQLRAMDEVERRQGRPGFWEAGAWPGAL